MTPTAEPGIHYTCVIGGDDVSLFPRLIGHYRSLGITSFRVIRQAGSRRDPTYAQLDRYADELGITFLHTYFGSYSLDAHQNLIRHAMDDSPDDWYVVSDSDEFHVYDRPLRDLVRLCEEGGYDHVSGCLLDRVADDGALVDPGTASMWQTYPFAGAISAALLRALPLKVGLVRGDVELLAGQHGAPEGRCLPLDVSQVQIHHFKWTATVLRRLEQRADLDGDGSNVLHPSIVREARRFLLHVRKHGGRINTADERFRLHRCGDRFTDHPQWRQILEEAQGWQWTLI